MSLEFTPVDLCSHFIVKLLTSAKQNITVYHLFNNNFMSIKDFVNTLQKINLDIQFVSLDSFKKALENNIDNNYFGITNYIENMYNNITLDNTCTNLILQTLNLKWPRLNSNYLIKIIKYLKTIELVGDKNDEEN